MDREYSPWYWHNKALREHPEYQAEGMMDCLREEMLMNMPLCQDTLEEPRQLEEPWDKRQWDTIKQLKAQVLFLSSKVNEMRASASKRKAFDKEDSL